MPSNSLIRVDRGLCVDRDEICHQRHQFETRDGANSVPVDPSNAQQLAAWNGDQGAYWASHAEQFEAAVAGDDRHLFAAAAINPGERVLDIGCGSGRTTFAAARGAAPGLALGVDLSARMIDVARQAAQREGLPNARFVQADAQIHPFPEQTFDGAISRTGAMFFGDPVAAFTNIARAMCPDGRLILLVWQPFDRNEYIVAITTALAAGRDFPPPRPARQVRSPWRSQPGCGRC